MNQCKPNFKSMTYAKTNLAMYISHIYGVEKVLSFFFEETLIITLHPFEIKRNISKFY